MMTLERVKLLSKQRGWSLQTTAKKAGIGINSIYRWNKKMPSTASLTAVAKVLGVSTDYLLGEDTCLETQNPAIDIADTHVTLQFDGQRISDDDRQALIDFLKFRRFQSLTETTTIPQK